jgi:uracil-DNA glycosylase
MMDLSPYILGCNGCRLCEGAAYQLPPFLFAGSSNPTVLVIAQNPGEIGSDDKWRLQLSALVEEGATAEAIKTVYDVDFVTSHGHAQMSKIFGEGWLTNGKFMYTNAVRCRTKDNLSPQPDMVANCMGWTAQLPLPNIVVLMGKVAMRQFCELVKKPELDAWKMVKLNKDKRLIHVVTIPHYAAMRSHAEMEKAKELFEKTVIEAGVTW